MELLRPESPEAYGHEESGDGVFRQRLGDMPDLFEDHVLDQMLAEPRRDTAGGRRQPHPFAFGNPHGSLSMAEPAHSPSDATKSLPQFTWATSHAMAMIWAMVCLLWFVPIHQPESSLMEHSLTKSGRPR